MSQMHSMFELKIKFQRRKHKEGCKLMVLVSIVKKLQYCSQITFIIIKFLICFGPSHIVLEKETSTEMFHKLVQKIHPQKQKQLFAEEEDKAKLESNMFVDEKASLKIEGLVSICLSNHWISFMQSFYNIVNKKKVFFKRFYKQGNFCWEHEGKVNVCSKNSIWCHCLHESEEPENPWNRYY